MEGGRTSFIMVSKLLDFMACAVPWDWPSAMYRAFVSVRCFRTS